MSPVSQDNLSPGNCVVATVFPKEIVLLTINVATYILRKFCRQEILSLACSRLLFYTVGKGVRSVVRGAKILNGDIEIRLLNACKLAFSKVNCLPQK